MSLVFLRWSGARIAGASGDRLLDLLDDLPEHGLPLACRGANCAGCRVRVTRGANLLQQPAAAERITLAGCGAGADERLACQIVLADGGDEEVELTR